MNGIVLNPITILHDGYGRTVGVTPEQRLMVDVVISSQVSEDTGLNQTVTEHYVQHSEAIETILQALDGYAAADSITGLEQTEIEHYVQHSDAFKSVLVALDGYASDITITDHYSQFSQFAYDVVSVLDGYSTNAEFAGLTTTVEENKNAQFQLNQSIVQALDGYATLINGLDTAELQHTQQQNQINQSVLQSLDGYAVLNIENQRWIDSSQQLQDLRDSLDGYGVTIQEHFQYQDQFNQSIIQSLDGYATLISSLDATELEHTQQQSQINQTILQALDGYAGGGGVSETTFQENKNAWNETIHQILITLDGYTTAVSSGVSEATFQENKDAQSEINHQIIAALDGYGGGIQGTATQLAYFSGTNTLTSDANLSYDVTNNRLTAYSIQITGGPPDDGYVLTSDANGVGIWKRLPIAFPSNRVFTVDATHSQADFTTIQEAINNASDGYMIIVSPGSYNEQLTLRAGISIEIIGASNNAASYVDVNYRLSGDGYVINTPDAGAGTTVFKNMRFSLIYDGFSGSTSTLLMRSSNFGLTFEDCSLFAVTQGALGGKMMGALIYGGTVELINCEISADDNDSIFDVDTIRIGGGNVTLKNTTTYGLNIADIRIDGGQASLTLESCTVVGAMVVGNAQNIFLDRVSRIGSISGAYDDDRETKLTHRLYGVGLTNGTNEFYKLHLRELGGDATTPGDGQIWYNRASGRFRIKEDGTVKDMIPYATFDGYASAPKREKSITIESPTATEDVSWFFVNRAVTVTEIRAVLVQSAASPSVTWTVRHGTDRNAAGAEVVTSGTTTTSITTGSDVTAFNDATIVADSFVWVETTASANTSQLHLTLFYTED